MRRHRLRHTVLLLCALLLLRLPCHHADGGPRPRIHVYNMPHRLSMPETSEVGVHPGTVILDLVMRSKYYEPDPAKADYFWIPGSGRMTSREIMFEVLDYVKQTWPWWNRTVAEGTARHILITTRDSDPGQSFGWPLYNTTKGIPPDVNPASASRNIIYLSFNGMRDGKCEDKPDCIVCFQPGKDIMMPKFQGVCNGPLCGFNLQTLRAKSIWALPPDKLEAEMKRERKRTLFFGGHCMDHHDFTGRGGLFVYFGHLERYLIQMGSSPGPKISFPEAMLQSEFCYSPLGGNGGPTDRYVSASMFGCIPILLNSSHASKVRTPQSLPLEEVVPWHRFSTLIDNYDLENLDKQLTCLKPHIPQMRAALQETWPSLVWTSLYGTFLTESGENDAFETMMKVLAQRIPHGFKPPPEVEARFTHKGPDWPCRPEAPPKPPMNAP